MPAVRPNDPLVDHLLDLMAPLATTIGAPRARRMFGGHGLFYDGLMFGLVTDGRCYLKADTTTLPRFEQEGSEPFRYRSRNRDVTLRQYLSLPPHCLDSSPSMCEWARLAIEAALRSANAAPRRSRPARKPGGSGTNADR